MKTYMLQTIINVLEMSKTHSAQKRFTLSTMPCT